MDDELQDLKVENALLHGCLYFTARRLKDYQDAPAFEIDDDGRPMLEVIVPPSLREKSAEALADAQRMLRNQSPEPTMNPASLQPSQARPDVTRDLIGTLDSVRATLKLRHMDEASDDDVEEALQMADEALANARGTGRAR
jgi:hypothetical protein